jgi:hypothetical protein
MAKETAFQQLTPEQRQAAEQTRINLEHQKQALKENDGQGELTPVQREAARQTEENNETRKRLLKEAAEYFGDNESGQMSDPNREHQIEIGQDPSGQTGVQVGKQDGVPVVSGVPQKGDEPNTQPASAAAENAEK